MTANHKYTSLLDSVEVPKDTKPTGQRKAGIHPRTSFDQGDSGVTTPFGSDEEDQMDDIRRAQRLTMSVSPINVKPGANRCIRQILRGEYDVFQKEAEKGLRRQRLYLVATDLSEEAAYALEWTIGTVLRDGDTLLAIYAIDEDSGTGQSSESSAVPIGEGAKLMEDAADVVKTFKNQPASASLTVPGNPSPLYASTAASDAGDESRASSVMRIRPKASEQELGKMDKQERERWLATEEVTDRCIKLLRKTKLQVRVVIEVFHCKSPKHMLTEAVSRELSCFYFLNVFGDFVRESWQNRCL